MKQLFVNGHIYLGHSFAEAMEISDNHITWIGSTEEASQRNLTTMINLEGKTVLPSFWDIHTHPLWISETLEGVPCTPPYVNSIEDMIQALKQSKQVGGTSNWIEGWGYDESKLSEHRTPTRHDLDKVSTTQSVYVMRSDCHSCCVNTVALSKTSITKDTPNPIGGEIGHFDNGEPNGVFTENGASQIIKNIKNIDTFDTIVRRTLTLGKHYRQLGVGVITDMISLLHPFDVADIYSEASRQGLAQRVFLYYSWDELREYGYSELPKPSHEHVTVAGIKLFMDGTISNQTAHTVHPFKHSESTGITINTKDDLLSAYEFAKKNHCQLSVHAMGDASIQLILDTFKDLDPWLSDIPSIRIEHATMLRDDCLAQFSKAKMNFAFVTQIIFLYAEYASYSQNLTDSDLMTTYRLKSMINSGVPTALSSDAPATAWWAPDDIWTSLTAAVTRIGANGEDMIAEEAISLECALALYTSEAAKMLPTHQTGQLKIGENANFIVLSDNIFEMKPDEWTSLSVERMYLDGIER